MNDIKELIALFAQAKILVIGDVMVDRYQKGQVSRISPEAPVPVVLLNNEQNRLGGAANVALNIFTLGGKAFLCSVIGAGENGVLFRSVMKEQNLDCQGIVSSSERITTIKTRIFSSGQQLLRLDTEDCHDLSKDEETILLKTVFSILEKEDIDVILFQDYNKGVLTLNVIKKLITYAKKHNIKTVVDPKMKNFFAYEGVSLFKPNLKEISESMGREIVPDVASLDKVVDELRDRLRCDTVLVTLSDKGMYANNGKESILMPTETKSVSDVSGAGDTVVGVVALGIAVNGDIRNLLSLANKAAGIVCTKLGVVPVLRTELEE